MSLSRPGGGSDLGAPAVVPAFDEDGRLKVSCAPLGLPSEAIWGGLTGTLADQTDLGAALTAAKARANHTGTQSADTLSDGTTNKAFLATERTKLTGIATSATANSADATLLARANHTGSQAASTISDFSTAADARIAAAVLNVLSDVTISSPANGQVLKFNGSAWVNDTDATGGGGSLTDGDKGDVTVSSSGAVWTVDAGAITYAKMQDVSAASRLLGRGSAGGAGDPEEITLGAGLTMTGTTLSSNVAGTEASDPGFDAYWRWNDTSGQMEFRTAAQTRTDLALSVDSVDFHVETAANKTYVLIQKAARAYTVNEIAAKTASGTITGKLQIDGVDVTGTSTAFSSTEAAGTASAANALAAGGTLSLVTSSNSTALDLAGSVKLTFA